MARERDSIRRDSAGVGPDPRMAGRLYRMSEIHSFQIARGEPDIRGWDVRTLSGTEIGKIDDLLIDQHRGEVVMVDIDLSDSDQHVHLPLRGVQIERDRHCVIVDSGDVRDAQQRMLGDPDNVDRMREDYRTADARADATDEVVIERRPIIEEVVVRRRVADDTTDLAEEER